MRIPMDLLTIDLDAHHGGLFSVRSDFFETLFREDRKSGLGSCASRCDCHASFRKEKGLSQRRVQGGHG